MSTHTPASPREAVAYVRVSTRRQGDNGIGLDIQMSQIQAFCKKAGYTLEHSFHDVHTGMGEESVRDRIGLQQVVRLAKRLRCPIVVANFDRISRNTKSLEDLVRSSRVEFISASDGENSRSIVFHSQAVRAQREGELISQRTKSALAVRKAQGIPLGNRTNLDVAQKKGAQSNKTSADRRAEILVPHLVEIHAVGITSAAAIAGALNARGLRTARGGLWNASNIRRPLKRANELISERKHRKDLDNPNWGIF